MLVFQGVAPIFTGGNGRQCHLQSTTGKRKKNSAGKEGCGRVPFAFQVPYTGAVSYRWRKQSHQPIQVCDYATIYDQFQKTSRVVRPILEASTARFVNFVTHLCHSPSTVSHSSMYECIDFVEMFIFKNHKNGIILLEIFSGQIIKFQQPRFPLKQRISLTKPPFKGFLVV